MANELYLPESTIKAFFKWTNFYGYQKVTQFTVTKSEGCFMIKLRFIADRIQAV